MTISEQTKLILAALNGWVKNNKGRTFAAADPLDVLDQLRAAPGAPTAAVLFVDEQVHGDYSELGRVLRTFKIVLSRGRGLKLVTGESLTDGVAGGEPLFDIVEQAREIVRGLRVADVEGEFQLPVYKGTGPFEVAGYILDAFEIRFAVFAALPREEIECPAAETLQNPTDTENPNHEF